MTLLFLFSGVGFDIALFTVAFGFRPAAAVRMGHGFLTRQGMPLTGAESEGESDERESKKTGHRARGG